MNGPLQNIILHNGNARPHTSHETHNAMCRLPKLKEHLKGNHFDTDDVVKVLLLPGAEDRLQHFFFENECVNLFINGLCADEHCHDAEMFL